MTAALEPSIGWRGAVIGIGVVGIVTTAALMLLGGAIEEGNKVKKGTPIMDSLRDLVRSPAVMLFFLFYVCSSASNVGITQYSVVAFQDMYSLERVVAVTALTAYQVGALLLVIPGGILADRISRYDLVIIFGFGLTAVLVFVSGTGSLPFWLVVGALCIAGATRGGVNASRDVAVRHVAAHIPIGTVFGFISTGFLLGQAVAGPFYGWLLDNYPPQYIFYVSAAVYVVGIMTVLINPGARQRVAAAE